MEAAAAGDARLVGFWVRATAGVPSARWTLSANGTGVYEVDFGPPYPGFVLTSRITKWSTNAANNTFTYTVDHQSALGNGPYNYDESVSPPKTYTTSYKITGTTNKIWAIEDYTYAQAGGVTDGPTVPTATLDKSYGKDGIAPLDVIAPTGHNVAFKGGAIQPKDGKLLVASGYQSPQGLADLAVSRFNIDGTPDKTFNSTGSKVIDFGAHEFVTGVAVNQENGKIVAAGESSGDVALACITPSGTLDTTFNGTGKVLTDVGGECDVYAVELQPGDGKILVAGFTPQNEVLLLRYLPNGQLDTTFNGTGRSVVVEGGAYCMAVQPNDGKIVIGGRSATQGYLLCRFNGDGTLDTTFNARGLTPGRFGIGNYRFGSNVGYPACICLSIRPDGKIVSGGNILVGSGWEYLLLASNNPDGTPDTGFNGTGKVMTEVSTGMTYGFFGWTTYYDGSADNMVLQEDGKIVVCGSAVTGTWPDSPSKTAVLRYNTNGTLDTTFNGTGKTFVDLGGQADMSHGLLIQPADGKLIIGDTREMARIFGRDYTPPNRKKYHTVTLGRVLAAQGTVSGGGGFPTGTKVTLKAKAKKGYKFAGWKEKGKVVSKKSPYTFTVKANRSLATVFKKG